ncbi:MAG: PAS domain S-box protein [SAR202 cluster bacterium]|nr:PAS domain S-box protein [SAR202 cluster bacterium]
MTDMEPSGNTTGESTVGLTAGDRQFRALIETALDVMAVLNVDGTFRYLSPSIQRVLGYLPEDLIGQNAFALMHEDDAPAQLEGFNDVVSEPGRTTVGAYRSFRFRHKDGRWIVLEAVSSKLPDGPEPTGIVVNARDITERTQAEEALREAAQEMEVIAEIGRIISSTLEIDDVYDLFAEQLNKLIEFDKLSIGISDVEKQVVEFAYQSGIDISGRKSGSRVEAKGSLTEVIIKTMAPLIVQGLTAQELDSQYPFMVKNYDAGMRSWMACPMVNRGEFVGPIIFHSSRENAFEERDSVLAERVCSQISGAVDGARIFADLRQAEAELVGSVAERMEWASQTEAIAEIGRIISSTLNIEEIYQPFANQVRRLIDCDVLAINLIEPDGQSTRIIHQVGHQAVGRMVGALVPIDGSLTGAVTKAKRTVMIQGESEQQISETYPQSVNSYRAGTRSWMCTPLISRGEVIGTLVVLSWKENAFTEDDADLVQRVSDQIAGAIGSSRLYAYLKQAEADLAVSNERSEMILETAHDAFVSIDDRGQVVSWNTQAEKTFGWSAGEAVRRRLSDLIIPDRFADQHLAGIRNFLATGQGTVLNQRLELVARHRDGHEFPVELTIAPLKQGDRYIFNAFIRDITDRCEAEEALRRSEERFRAVYNYAPNGIGTRGLDGSIIDLNPAFLRMVGYTMDEIRELEPGTLYNASYIEFEKGLWQSALQGEEIPPYEMEYIRKDGTKFYGEIRASIERDEDGNAVGIIGVVSDVTERKRLEEEIAQYTKSLEIANQEMQQLDRMKDEFISTVSHELRTPLTSIKGSAEILLTYEEEDRETQLEFLRIINNESDRLTRLIDDVLDLSRMESRQMRWLWEELDLADVVNAAVDVTQALAMQKNLSITVGLAEDLPRLWNDRDRLAQVVTNLLSNSIKFTPDNGKVKITAKALAADESDGLGEKLEVCVSDTGIGIAMSDYEDIFQKFHQGGDTLSDKPKGTGLGLPICKEIIEYFGGKIWVESTPGNGSSFYFTVPVSAGERVPLGDNAVIGPA